jgi:hypothetical protein
MTKFSLTLVASLGLAVSAFAGHEVATTGKDYKAMPAVPCFKDQEVQIDLFGTYNDSVNRSRYSDDFGGGVAVNYFFYRYVGIGIEGNVFDGGAHGVWQMGGRLLARYPLELGGTCIAPYIFGGGGAQLDGLASGYYTAGGGLEWRATPSIGLFGEGRYTWASVNTDSGQARVGVRFVF